MIPYGRQTVTEDDIEAVAAALRDDLITLGPRVSLFESKFAEQCEARFAVAANSATSSLHLACLALGVDENSLVWTVPNTFVASANCARYAGAMVDFVDIDPQTYNISVDALEKKLEDAEKAGRTPDVVIVVHFSGRSCDMAEIAALAEKYDFRIIEDASHAIGARYASRPVGCCAYSDIAVFSLHPVKIITAGEGGMATTNQQDLADRMRELRTHGITRDTRRFVGEEKFEWCYEQQSLGFNYRITDFQAALGMSQMERLEEIIARRNELAAYYEGHFNELDIQLPEIPTEADRSSWHLYVIRIPESGKIGRNEAYYEYRRNGIGVQVHYIPVHTQPYYRELGFGPGDFPVAEKYYAEALTLPLFPQLTEAELHHVVSVTQQLFGK